MKIKVLFFGVTQDLTGLQQEQTEIPEGTNLDGLWRRYAARFPRLHELSGVLLLAVNQEIADRARTLRDGDEVAFMPPVSGGSGADFYLLTRLAIPTADLVRQLKVPEDGAVVVFEGIVRNNSRGRRTLYLEYEAYEPMAMRKMEEIGREARRKFEIDHIGIVTGWDGSKLVRRVWRLSSPQLTGAPPSRPANSRSIGSSKSYPYGRRNILRTALSGWRVKGSDMFRNGAEVLVECFSCLTRERR